MYAGLSTMPLHSRLCWSLVTMLALGILATFPTHSKAYRLANLSRLPAHKKCGAFFSRRPLVDRDLSRSQVLSGGISAISGSFLVCLGASFLQIKPVIAADEGSGDKGSPTFVTCASSSGIFRFLYPETWTSAPKLLQTHQEEVTLKSKNVLGFSAGVAVDPVRIESIQESGSPSEVGARIVALEGKKEGVSKVELLGSAQEGDFYTFDYEIPMDAYEANEATISRMLQSLQVNETNGK